MGSMFIMLWYNSFTISLFADEIAVGAIKIEVPYLKSVEVLIKMRKDVYFFGEIQ